MNSLGSHMQSRRHDTFAGEIAFRGSRGANRDSFVGHPNVRSLAVGFGKNRYARDLHLPKRADHPNRDLTPIGHQYFTKQFRNAPTNVVPNALRS